MTYDSIDNRAYCPCNGTDAESLAVIDGRTHSLVKKLGMPGATTAVWDPISDRVYVSCQSTNKVAVVDCSTDSLLKYITVGACPMNMCLNATGRRLYVQNYDAGTVSIVDLTNDHVIRTLNVGGNPNAGYYCPGADKFYSAGPIRQCVVISGQSDTIVARVALSGNAVVVSATGNENGGLVYLGTYDVDDHVVTVSTADDSVLTSTLWGIPLTPVTPTSSMVRYGRLSPVADEPGNPLRHRSGLPRVRCAVAAAEGRRVRGVRRQHNR